MPENSWNRTVLVCGLVEFAAVIVTEPPVVIFEYHTWTGKEPPITTLNADVYVLPKLSLRLVIALLLLQIVATTNKLPAVMVAKV